MAKSSGKGIFNCIVKRMYYAMYIFVFLCTVQRGSTAGKASGFSHRSQGMLVLYKH